MSLFGYELPVRLAFFLFTFVALAFWEQKSQRVRLTQNKQDRWLNHFALAFLTAILVRAFLPLVGVSIAWFAMVHRFGLFNQIELPPIVVLALSVVNLDWALYYQHRALHAAARLWKCHRVHHSDLDFDVSTGVRFHFLEIGFTLFIKAIVILALGCPPTAVFTYEVAYMIAVLFNHANIQLPPAVEKALRLFIVTPDMHRIHHSIARPETNSNFSFIFSWWDRAFGTYRPGPAAGIEAMTVGLENVRDPVSGQLPNLVLQPFLDQKQTLSMENFKSAETAYTQGK
jgi:sterol desaturase/sphingolipid hydroxylase (fatty acid hydroxylase superfamily)